MKRVIIIVMDSVGMGELPDADKYGDKGSNTIGNISKSIGGLKVPNLKKLGLGNIDGIEGIEIDKSPIGCFGRMAEKSAGKDTTTGHCWPGFISSALNSGWSVRPSALVLAVVTSVRSSPSSSHSSIFIPCAGQPWAISRT